MEKHAAELKITPEQYL